MATRTLHTPSILLVGNSVDEQEAYARALHGWGCKLVRAATTVLAYRIATTTPTDMVVTVAHCAGSMSGLELTRRLRLHTRTTAVPIIVLTRDTRRQDGELSIKAGADLFLERPVSGDVLREHVARLLVASGRVPHQASPHRHERVSFVRGAMNRQRAHASSSSQTRTPIPPMPVSRSNGNADGSMGGNADPVDVRTCPHCRGLLEYRQKWPVLSALQPDRREPRDRLRYVSGWFCSDPACEYQELVGANE
jgi:two-component system, chemotaxis family, chemotaxis protein CheY